MNIYVGNLPASATEETLRALFEEFGQVTSVKIMKDKFTGQLRGFAFVEMAPSAQSNDAINALNGREFQGSRLRVNEARPREARPMRPHSGGPRPFNSRRMQ